MTPKAADFDGARFDGIVTGAGEKIGTIRLPALTNNILSTVAIVATAEAFLMGAQGELDPQLMIATIREDSGGRSMTQQAIPPMRARQELQLRRVDSSLGERHRSGS